jgi:catechol 2,3-dioxygenase-like lactoylglutathione lyase family enzyme
MEHSTKLGEAAVHTTLPAEDLDRARRFYSEKLGLEPKEESGGGLLYEMADGGQFFVFTTSGPPSGEHTQIGFRTKDIDAVVDELRTRGVKFEEYDMPSFTTVGGIVNLPDRRAAWFRDSEGNLLGIVQLA